MARREREREGAGGGMNPESVVEFLSAVPLLQPLPSSSLKKIAEIVEVKNFDTGEVVLHHGVDEGGIYFIWEGEAEVYGHDQEAILPEFQLRRYDCFGNGATPFGLEADVIASSKLTCLMLPNEHSALLWPKSIWSTNEKPETSSLMERILHLQPLEVNLFRGFTLPDAPQLGNIFGGQFMGQALAAASKTVDCLKTFHHLQAYFLLVGDVDVPIIYNVQHIHDGKSFATRRVNAVQKGNIVFTLLASFQKEEMGFEHQIAVIPSVPPPDQLLSMEELRERQIIDPRLPRTYCNKIATTKFIPWPIEIRFCDPNPSTNRTRFPPSLRYWFKAKGKLADDQALHMCVIAYASDLMFIQVSLNPYQRLGLKISVLSLNHTMWFHKPIKADDWILFLIESPIAHDGRGLCVGKMFNQKGELIVSLTQEGVIRRVKPPTNTEIRAKF